MITGPITEAENNDNNFWGTWVYKGGKLTVDFRVPVESKSLLKLHLSSVAYGFKDIYKTEVGNFGASEPCNINVLCAPIGNGWENERNSVSLILNGNSTEICSGALINNTCNFNIPYLLTANHCFDGNVTNWKFTFQAWSSTCTPSQNANGITFNGSTLRARNAASDFCLVELSQLPPANSRISFSGWSRNVVGIQNTTIIHHPAGDVMKISRDNHVPVFDNFSGAQCWRLGIDQGATQGGSSGAPYYDQNHRIIAQHYGVNNTQLPICERVNKFGGRFDLSWTGGGTNATRLSNWLDPNNTGAMTTNARSIGISGPGSVCTTAQYFFAGQNVTWSSSNPSALTINTTGFATRINNFTGQVTISATINGPCGNAVFTRLVPLGIFSQSNVSVTGPYAVCPGNWYTYTANIPGGHYAGYTYQWSKPSSWTVQYQSSNFITFSVPSSFGGGVVSVSVNNGCGSSSPASGMTVSENSGCYSYSFSISPNPATDVLTVELTTEEDSVNTDNISKENVTEYNVELTTDNGQKVLTQSTKDGIIRIDTKALRRGLYFIKILYRDEVTTKRVVLK